MARLTRERDALQAELAALRRPPVLPFLRREHADMGDDDLTPPPPGFLRSASTPAEMIQRGAESEDSE